MANKTFSIYFDEKLEETKVFSIEIISDKFIALIFNDHYKPIDIRIKWKIFYSLLTSDYFEDSNVIIQKHNNLEQLIEIMKESLKKEGINVNIANVNKINQDENNRRSNDQDENKEVVHHFRHKDILNEGKTVEKYFDQLMNLIKSKLFKFPNFERLDHFAVHRQINWLHTVLDNKMSRTHALQLIEKIRPLKLETFYQGPKK